MMTSVGLYGFNWINDRERHLNRSYADDLYGIQDRMSSLNRWSLSLLVGGGITTLLGYAWQSLTSKEIESPSPDQDSPQAMILPFRGGE